MVDGFYRKIIYLTVLHEFHIMSMILREQNNDATLLQELHIR